jgi:hypothetical protein
MSNTLATRPYDAALGDVELHTLDAYWRAAN